MGCGDELAGGFHPLDIHLLAVVQDRASVFSVRPILFKGPVRGCVVGFGKARRGFLAGGLQACACGLDGGATLADAVDQCTWKRSERETDVGSCSASLISTCSLSGSTPRTPVQTAWSTLCQFDDFCGPLCSTRAARGRQSIVGEGPDQEIFL